MGLCYLGLDSKTEAITVVLNVSPQHPLIKLAQAIPWEDLVEMVLPDLKKTTSKGFINVGRKLNLRTHLAAYLLQETLKLTDRRTEWDGKDNAAVALFCGYGVVGEKWSMPDHTSIQTFRSRISPETVKQIANFIAKHAVDIGFADPRKMDQDSTIQEANMQYPSDVSLMVKGVSKVKKVLKWLAGAGQFSESLSQEIDLKKLKKKVREYFFSRTKKDQKATVFNDIFEMVKTTITEPVKSLKEIPKSIIKKMPWNIKDAYEQVSTKFTEYLSSVKYFIDNRKIDPNKILSWHLNEVSCFNKGKQGKGLQFGRNFQLGRIGGNFVITTSCTSVRMEDKESMVPLIKEHQAIFGLGVLESYGADKGFHTSKNQAYLNQLKGLLESALQRPGISFNGCLFKEEEENYLRLSDRRSGIEPVIGHIKHGGQLGKSKMKSDQSTLAAGYRSIVGYNLRCLKRHLIGKEIKPM